MDPNSRMQQRKDRRKENIAKWKNRATTKNGAPRSVGFRRNRTRPRMICVSYVFKVDMPARDRKLIPQRMRTRFILTADSPYALKSIAKHWHLKFDKMFSLQGSRRHPFPHVIVPGARHAEIMGRGAELKSDTWLSGEAMRIALQYQTRKETDGIMRRLIS